MRSFGVVSSFPTNPADANRGRNREQPKYFLEQITGQGWRRWRGKATLREMYNMVRACPASYRLVVLDWKGTRIECGKGLKLTDNDNAVVPDYFKAKVFVINPGVRVLAEPTVPRSLRFAALHRAPPEASRREVEAFTATAKDWGTGAQVPLEPAHDEAVDAVVGDDDVVVVDDVVAQYEAAWQRACAATALREKAVKLAGRSAMAAAFAKVLA